MVDSFARRIIVGLLTRLTGGTLEVVDEHGTQTFGDSGFGDRRPGAGPVPIDARVVVHEPRLYARLLRDGSVGLGESYAQRWWDTDDLAAFLRLAHRNLARTHPARDRVARRTRPLLDPLARLRSADKQRDSENIHAHYDVGNELFRRVLDETMMYSCAVFESPDEPLAVASLRKLDRLATMLQLTPDDHVLEIGTGWGGFAVHAARRYGCRVTTTTISEEQYRYAQARVHDAGLDRLIDVRYDDYRDLRGTFDKVVAIEMIEAVDWREYEMFFAQVRRLLSDSGLCVMQAIVVPDKSFDRTKHHTDFIKAAIFPGGCLPSVGALTKAANSGGGMALVRLDDIGVHYAETLRRWRANLVGRRDDLATHGFDDRFTRLWEFYFAYCEAGFDERYVSVGQLAYAAPGWRPQPHAPSAPRVRHLSSV